MTRLFIYALLFLFLGALFATPGYAEETLPPLKQLALAQADAEIALRQAREEAGAFQKSYADKRDRLSGQAEQVNRVIDAARRAEDVKPGDERNPTRVEQCLTQAQAIDDLRNAQQAPLRQLESGSRRILDQLNHLQEGFNAARVLTEQWKETDLPLASLLPLYDAMAAESKKLSGQLPALNAELNAMLAKWDTQLQKAKEDLGGH